VPVRQARVNYVSARPVADQLVSVVVPMRNSAAHVVPCLESIRAQTHERIEVVAVDNHSSDGTAELVAPLADRFLVVGPERSAQRNAGALASRGDHLLFIDSDMVLEPNVVRECVEAVDADSVGRTIVVIPEVSVGKGFWARCKALERSCYVGEETIEAARCFPRAFFLELDGFDEHLPAGPEDWDLHERARLTGARVVRTSAYIQHDEGALRLKHTLAKKFHYGGSMGAYIRRHPTLARRQLLPIRPAFLRHWRRLASEPGLAAGMMFMKSLEFLAGAAGLSMAIVRRRGSHDPHAQ
jgi:glycosyltransferase involved in cell wall biosynthesis